MMLILQHSAELFAGMRCRRFAALLPELPAALGCDADTPKQMAAPAQKQRCVNNRRSQKEKNNTATPRVTPVVCPSRRRQCHAAVLIREDAPSRAVHRHQLLGCFHMKKKKKRSGKQDNVQNGKPRLSTLFRKRQTDGYTQADRSTKTCIANEFLREAAPARKLHC